MTNPKTPKSSRTGGGVSRRDLLHGFGAAAAASFVPGSLFAQKALAAELAGTQYPPSLTGMRGNHDGAWEVAHALAREGRQDWGIPGAEDNSDYDLIVVGAGISGLSAAHFWQKACPGARILLLENHDDFGGHAKRNEFSTGGDTLIGYGGSQTLVEPKDYPEAAKELLDDLAIDLDAFETAYDRDFFRRNNLAAGLYFDEKLWGQRHLATMELGTMLEGYLEVAPPPIDLHAAVSAMPLPDKAREQLEGLVRPQPQRIPGDTDSERWAYLWSVSYEQYLRDTMGITEPSLFKLLQDLAADSGTHIGGVSADMGIFYAGLPNLGSTGIVQEKAPPYIHHFPDGNAAIARLLVRKMIPECMPGNTMSDVVMAPLDYAKLDSPDNAVNLRLNSTVINVSDAGGAVDVTYVRNGKSYRAKGKYCVMACYNAIIPSICPALPDAQKAALSEQVKSPILYTNVAVRNWEAWEKLGVGIVFAPGCYHINAMLDFPVSMGGYNYSADASQPAVIHLERFPRGRDPAMKRKDQYRMGRYELLATPFETMEQETRTQLAGMLGPGGFDPDRDILGITVNRWAHGYSYFYGEMDGDPWYEDYNDPRFPHVRARQTRGRIAIANSDAGASAMFESAVVQARRAVNELFG